MQAIFYKLTHSLNGLRLLVSSLTIGIALVVLSVTWNLVREHDLSETQVGRTLHGVMLDAKVGTLAAILDHYKQSVLQIAGESDTVDQFLVPDERAQEDWALASRRYLRDSLGLALVQPDGTLGGDPARLRVGAQCHADLKRMLAGEQMPRPLIHRGVEGLEHIDIVAPVMPPAGETDDGRPIGYLFVSFHLAVLKQWLAELTDPGYRLTLEAGDGSVVAEVDRIADGVAPERLETLSKPIADTRMTLHLSYPLSRSTSFMSSLATVLLWGLLALVALPVLASFRFWGLVKNDFCTLHRQLTQIGQGVRHPQRPQRPYLLDMRDIVDEMYALVTRIGAQQSNLSHQSMHDHLTGMPNRRYIEDEILRACAQAQRGGASYAVMLVDLDNFKQVNDTLGHDAGDSVLCSFAECARNNLRSADFAGRWAGDEFVLVCVLRSVGGSADKTTIDHLVTRLRRCFAEEQRQQFGDDVVPATLSIGRMTMSEGCPCEAPEVLRRADEAMYAAKQQGRNTLVDAPQSE